MKLEISGQIFFSNIQIKNFMENRPAGSELFHADGQVDRQKDVTELLSIFVIFRTRREMIRYVPRSKHTSSRLYKTVS